MRDALPKASFIGFTGTLIESGDKNTQAVFGDYIDVYDILQSKEDKRRSCGIHARGFHGGLTTTR